MSYPVKPKKTEKKTEKKEIIEEKKEEKTSKKDEPSTLEKIWMWACGISVVLFFMFPFSACSTAQVKDSLSCTKKAAKACALPCAQCMTTEHFRCLQQKKKQVNND